MNMAHIFVYGFPLAHKLSSYFLSGVGVEGKNVLSHRLEK